MVRLPRYAHPQAARRTTGKLAWRPGWQGTGQQPIQRVPVAAYTRLISGVPLNGGQAQGVIPGVSATGALPAPSSFSVIAQFTFPAAGTFLIPWTVTLGGTVSATEQNNFQLYINESVLAATSVNAASDGSYVQSPATVTVNAGDTLTLTNPLSGTAGSVYGGTISGPSTPLSLSIGPQGLGTVWYPIQVTLSTTTGALDTSLAAVYLGPAVTPATLVGQLFSGNGTVALAIPNMTPGQQLVIIWTGGHPGDIAAANVIGTMSALSTQ